MKICARCKISKESSDFPLSKQHSDGLFSYCKQCCKEKQIEYVRKRGIRERRRRTKDELPLFKICTRCKTEKPRSEFREKLENGKYWTLVPACNKCSAEVARINYNKRKNDEEFKNKNRERANAYRDKNLDEIKLGRSSIEFLKNHAEYNKKDYHKRKDFISIKNTVKRQTQSYKENRKRYILANKEKIARQEKICKIKYHIKNRDAISDVYVISQLKSQKIDITPQNIELKRTKIILWRLKKLIHEQENIRPS